MCLDFYQFTSPGNNIDLTVIGYPDVPFRSSAVYRRSESDNLAWMH
jgi:hypothetical protein